MAGILQRFDDMTPKRFAAGERLIEEGNETGKLFVLKSGAVEVRRAGRLITTISEAGAVLGEMSALLDRPYTASVVAIDEVEAYGLDDGVKFLESRPALALHVAVLLAQRLETTTALVQTLKRGQVARPRDAGLFGRLLGFLTGHSPDKAVEPPKFDKPRI
jgi:CRP/FNR family cyclic AMP-dependent transcriptional regulator